MCRFYKKNFCYRMIAAVFLAALCLNGVTPPAGANGAWVGVSPADLQSFFDAVLQEQLDAEHIAGAAAAVVQSGELVFARGYGYADLEAGIPVQADRTLFFIGSDGKLFTWTAVMQLAGQGKLDLHADVNRYLDFEIPAAFDSPITMHHLMTHTAGFEEDFDSLLLDDPEKLIPLREHLVRYLPARVYPPGEVSAYSNYGTALAGYIVERVSGQLFETYLTELLLQPLGMDRSFVGNSLPETFAADLSKGYQYQNGRYLPLDFEWTAAVPCAPVRTTMTDLSRFMIAHLNGGCAGGACILPAGMVDLMHSPQFTHHPQMSGMAYGFLDMEFNGQRVLWHMGESARFITVLALLPEQSMGLVVSYNTPPADGRDILFRFMDEFFPDDRPPLDAAPLTGWETRAELFNGTYIPARSAHTTPEILVRYTSAFPVSIAQGRLSFSGWNFVEVEPGLFRQVDGDRVLAFRRGADGRRWMFVGALAYFQPPWHQTPAFLLALLAGSLLVILTAWISALIAVLRRRPGGRGGVVWWLAGGLGLFHFALLARMAAVLLSLADRYVYHGDIVAIISGLYWLAVPWTLAVLGAAVYAWIRSEWTLAQRVHYSLVALAAAALFWFAWSVNLLG